MTTPILGEQSQLVYRNVPDGFQCVIFKNGIATLSTCTIQQAIHYPSDASRLVHWKATFKFKAQARLSRISQLMRLQAKSRAIKFACISILVITTAFLVIPTTGRIASNRYATSKEKPILRQAHPQPVATISTAKTTPVITQTLQLTVPSPTATVETFTNKPVTANTAEAVPVPQPVIPRFQMPPLRMVGVLSRDADDPFANQRQTRLKTSSEKPKQEPALPASDGIDVDLGSQTKKQNDLPQKPSPEAIAEGLKRSLSLSKTASYRAITTNEGELVIQLVDGKFKQIRTGQQLPNGETLQSVEQGGTSYTTSAGTQFLPKPKDTQ